MRKTTPFLILAVGLLALAIDLLPNLRLPDSRAADGTRPIETKLGLDLLGAIRTAGGALGMRHQQAGRALLPHLGQQGLNFGWYVGHDGVAFRLKDLTGF